MSDASTLPARAAVGFKPAHFRDIIAAAQPVGFFEVHAEHYMGAGGEPHAQLGALRERYALSLHGVGLSIGSMLPLPYTPPTLTRVAEHIDAVQTVLRRPILLENPSSYLNLVESTIPEVEF